MVFNVLKEMAQKRKNQCSQSPQTPKAQSQPEAAVTTPPPSVPRSHHLTDPGGENSLLGVQ